MNTNRYPTVLTPSYPPRRSSKHPAAQDAFTIFAQYMGHTRFVAGTLAMREELRAPIPQVDPRPILTMDDMGHGMMMGGGMDHSMAGMSGGAMAGMSHAGMDHSNMGHAEMAKSGTRSQSGMDHSEIGRAQV